MSLLKISSLALLLCGCASSAPPAVQLEIQREVVRVRERCPVEIPARPAPLGPLPANLEQAARQLLAKLMEYADDGGYADRADAALAICTRE